MIHKELKYLDCAYQRFTDRSGREIGIAREFYIHKAGESPQDPTLLDGVSLYGKGVRLKLRSGDNAPEAVEYRRDSQGKRVFYPIPPAEAVAKLRQGLSPLSSPARVVDKVARAANLLPPPTVEMYGSRLKFIASQALRLRDHFVGRGWPNPT